MTVKENSRIFQEYNRVLINHKHVLGDSCFWRLGVRQQVEQCGPCCQGGKAQGATVDRELHVE